MAELDGRTALVTGGGRGIGRATALALARDGARVVISWHRDERAARDTVDVVRALGAEALAVRAAMDSEADCEALVRRTAESFGWPGILVHCAGRASRGSRVTETEPSEARDLMRIHALAAHDLARLVVPAMREMTRGDVVFVSSAITRTFPANSAPYSMAKAALEALAAVVSKEEEEHNIHVNVVAPGLTETEMGRRMARSLGVEDLRSLDRVSPFGRVATPEDVVAVVRFLVSEAAGYVSGQRIYVDGSGAARRLDARHR